MMPCPFCGETNAVHMMMRRGIDGWRDCFYVLCDYDDGGCGASGQWAHTEAEAAAAWNRRVQSVTLPLYDKEETIEGCCVQILTNTVTGEQSIGWWRGTAEDMPLLEG